MPASTAARWVVVIVVALMIIGLLAWARGNPGDAGRSTDKDNAAAVVEGR